MKVLLLSWKDLLEIPLDILANGVQIARGEVVMVGERFGVRFTEVSNPEDTVKKL